MKVDKTGSFMIHPVVNASASSNVSSTSQDKNASNVLGYVIAKKVFDMVISTMLLPVFLTGCLLLAVANPFLNRGPIFYVQKRMGRDCKPFMAIKFRSMTCVAEVTRGADDPLEVNRITPLGGFLRKSRLDEIPQVINVLRGEMSLIGPRPDCYEHAETYIETIPGYHERHAVLPGISGLAQTEVGYVQGIDATRLKVAADLDYINRQSFRLDTWILWRTLKIIAGRSGA